MNEQNNIVPLQDVERMGQLAAASGYLGTRNANEAITLMLVAQSENRHPMSVAKEYHIIKGKPSLRADAMLARFQIAGGSVRWKEMSDTRVVGIFSHPQGGELEVDWDMDRARKAQVISVNPNWVKYPRQMLRARCISEGVRAVFPAVISGFYTPEEVEDFAAEQKPAQAEPEVAPEVRSKRKKAADALKEAAAKAAKPEAVEVEAQVVETAPAPTAEEVKAEAAQAFAEATPAPEPEAPAPEAEPAPEPQAVTDDVAQWIEEAREAADHGVPVSELKEKGWQRFGRPLPKPVLDVLMEIYRNQKEA